MKHLPPGIHSTSGPEFAELAESAGLHLDSWQRYHVNVATAERADGKWAADEYVDVVPRQNGKGAVIEALTLGFMFLLRVPLMIHTAHEFKTASESFLRVKSLIDNTDDLRRKVSRVWTAHGAEGIELTRAAGGGRLRFLARSAGSGRGFSAPVLVLDEAFKLDAETMAALLPTLSAQPNPWVGYFSSAPKASSAQLHALRRRALAGNAGRLAYLEHSVDPENLDRSDPKAWAMANPALGIRISEDFVRTEFGTLPPEIFDRERLGIADPEHGTVTPTIPVGRWTMLADPGSEWSGAPVGVVDVSPTGRASIALCGVRADGRRHVELVDNRAGTSWIGDRRTELSARYGVKMWIRDPNGPAVELEGEWRDLSGREYAEACTGFLRAVLEDDTVRWRCAAELEPTLHAAVLNAVQGTRGDGAWTWSRKRSEADISPLVALTVGWSLCATRTPDLASVLW